MTIRTRKSLVASLIVSLLLLANLPLIVSWLEHCGLVPWAHFVQAKYLTGTAISVIIVLFFVLPARQPWEQSRHAARCGTCDHRLPGQAKYCPDCGSRV